MTFLEFPIASDPSGLVVIGMRRGCWRVLDSRSRFHRPDRLLGFIERVDPGRYEVLWVEPSRWAYVDDFEAALAAIGDPANFHGMVSEQREQSSPLAAAG